MSISRTLFYNYDIPATLTYGRFYDAQNLRGFIETSGSSTTTTATETTGAGSTPFDQVAVGDWLQVGNQHSGYTLRRVTAKASSTSLTVNSAWDLDSQAGKFWPFRSGTGTTDGQVYIGSFKNVAIKYSLTTLGATNVRFVVEVKGSGPDATWFQIFDETLTATGSDSFSLVEPWSYVRVGVDETSGSGTDSIDVFLLADDNASIS